MADVVRATMDELYSANELNNDLEIEAILELDRLARSVAKTFVEKF